MKQINTRYGLMNVFDTDPVVSKSLQYYGEWAQDEIDLIALFIKPSDVVLDIGAFIGTHTLAFSNFVGESGHVYSIEPRKEIFETLRQNISINHCTNTTVLNIGLSNVPSKIKMNTLDINDNVNFGGLSLNESLYSENEQSYEIILETIDSLNLDKLEFIKIDVEGMEIRVLDGGKHTLAKLKPFIFAECNSLADGAKLLSFAEQNNYIVLGVINNAYNPNNFYGVSDNIFGIASEVSLILVPQEKHQLSINKLSQHRFVILEKLDSLVLLMLHKPQYVEEVLTKTNTNFIFGVDIYSHKNNQMKEHIQILENISNQRLDTIHELTSQIQATEIALRNAELMAFERLDIISKLNNDKNHG